MIHLQVLLKVIAKSHHFADKNTTKNYIDKNQIHQDFTN